MLEVQQVGAVGVAEPALSQPLEALIRSVLAPHASEVGRGLDVPPVLRGEAKRQLAAYVALCRPVPERQVRAWLMAVNGAVRNPLSEGDFEVRLAMVMLALGDTPAAIVTRASLREAQRQFEFMPAVADLAKLWAGPAFELRSRRDALRRIAEATPPEERRDLSLQEREAILERHRRNMAPILAAQEERALAEVDMPPSRSAAVRPDVVEQLRAANPIVQAARAAAGRRGG